MKKSMLALAFIILPGNLNLMAMDKEEVNAEESEQLRTHYYAWKAIPANVIRNLQISGKSIPEIAASTGDIVLIEHLTLDKGVKFLLKDVNNAKKIITPKKTSSKRKSEETKKATNYATWDKVPNEVIEQIRFGNKSVIEIAALFDDIAFAEYLTDRDISFSQENRDAALRMVISKHEQNNDCSNEHS